MNQRFQSADIRHVAEQYAENELYLAICTIGSQLEAELEFGLCPEECFMEASELLSIIVEKGEDILPSIDDIWLRKFNEYRRFDRHISEEEIRKAVAIVFGFVILATDSSRDRFYRYTLSRRLMETIAGHPFSDWPETLDRIFSVPLADGWFDFFITSEFSGSNNLQLPKELDTKKARQYFAKAIQNEYMEKVGDYKYHWIGTNDKGNRSELAYFCGKVYGYVHTITGNAGEDFPEESLNKLFGVKRLYSSLTQVYNAKKPQRWRSQIDAIFE